MSNVVVTSTTETNRVVVEEDIVRIITVTDQSATRVVSVGTQGPPGSSSWRVGTATWAANMSLDWSNYDLIRLTLQGDTTFISFAPVTDGRRVVLELTHDSGGGYEVTWPASVRYSASLPMISLSANPLKTDRVGFIYNDLSSTFDVLAVARGF
jgi:hypothetical protein